MEKVKAIHVHNHMFRDLNVFLLCALKQCFRVAGAAFVIFVGRKKVRDDLIGGDDLNYVFLYFLFSIMTIATFSEGVKSMYSTQTYNEAHFLLSKVEMLPPQHSHRKKGSTNREQRGHKHQPFQYIFSGLLLLAGVAVVVSMTNVEVGCNDAVIVCKRSGLSCTASRAEIVVTQSFDITDGTLTAVSSVLDACAAAYANMADDEAENSTSATFFTGDDDMRGEDEAEEEFFSALVANPTIKSPFRYARSKLTSQILLVA